MNKRTEILIHCAIWLYMLLAPLTFMRTYEHGWVLRYLCMTVAPLMTLAVFYAYYLSLYRLYMDHERRHRFFVITIVGLIALAIVLHLWNELTSDFVHPNRPAKPEQGPSWIRAMLFILHDVFNFAIAATIATALRLSQHWKQADLARKEAESARAEAELSNLRSQINPHFLLNTLNNIYALTAFDTDKAQSAVMELSKLLRHILYDFQQPSVELKDEAEFIKNYVNLMKIRLSSNVDVKMEVNIAEPTTQIAPLIFISLIENAFKHGVSPTQPSFVHIKLEQADNTISCSIDNSNHPKTEKDRSGHGIGLTQVERRLQLSYPDRYTWEKGIQEENNTYHSKITINL